MASRDSPKKEDQGKDVQKQGALNARVTKLCTSLQETMAQGEMLGQESSVTGTPPTRHRNVPGRSATTDGIHHQESYCLLVRVIKDALGLSERDVRVPTHAWDENIATDICESQIGCPPGTYKVQLLSNTEFLLRKRPTSRLEMNWQDTNAMIRLVHGEFLWCGVPVSLAARHRTEKEAKYDLDATFAYRHTGAQEWIALSKFQKDSKRSVITPKETLPHGRGMICHADKHFAKKLAGGMELEQPALHATAGSLDGYHSAREPSDFDNDTEEELQDVESKEEPMVEFDNSDTSSVQSGHTSLRSQRSTMENRDWKRTRGRLRAMDSLQSTNAKKGIKGRTPDGKKSKVVLSMF